jgi:tripartite-type tricarboxylate transporter receptor subunit TctC
MILSVSAMALAQGSGRALAQTAPAYPVKPIRWVLAFGAPGGAPDTIARTMGPKLTEAWGHQVIVDPRIARAMKLPEVRERLAPQMIEPVGSPPAELAAFLQREIVKWAAIVKESGAKVD